MDVQLPDLTVLRGVPDGTTKAQIAQKLQAGGRAIPPEWLSAAPKESSLKELLARSASEVGKFGPEGAGLLGLGETALQGATGAAGTVLGGLAGIPALAKGPDAAADVVRDVQSALTYKPRTATGQLLSKAGQALPDLMERGSDVVGQAVADKLGPAAGAAAKTALQAAPTLLTRGRVGKSATAEQAAAPAEAAKAYVSRNTSLDWDTLSERVKSTLTQIAQDSKNLDKLDPKAVERQARLDALNLPATRGQITRDVTQLTREENISKSEAGKPVRDINAEQDRILHEHLDTLRKQTGGTATTRQGVGQSVQSAARKKLAYLESKYREKYQAAEQVGETRGPVDIKPLNDWLNDPANRRNAPYLEKAIKDYAKSDGAITINDLEQIRKEATANALGPPSTAKHYASQAVKVIDSILDNAGGNVYKDARKAYAATKSEFEGQGAVKKLVSSKGKASDRATVLEDTFDSVVLRGSNEQLTNVRDSLTKGGTAATQNNGLQAWRDLQAATIDYFKDKAAGKRAIPGEKEQLQFNSSFLDALYDLDKDGKLDTLFGEGTAQKIREIAQATRDVRTKPAGRVAGSDTTPRILSMLEKAAEIPIAGKYIAGAAKVAKKVGSLGEETREARKATRTPLEEAAEETQRTVKKKQRNANTIDSLRGASGAGAATLEQRDRQ